MVQIIIKIFGIEAFSTLIYRFINSATLTETVSKTRDGTTGQSRPAAA